MYVMPRKIDSALRDRYVPLLWAHDPQCEVKGPLSRNGKERCASVCLNRVSCRASDNGQVDLNRESAVRNGEIPTMSSSVMGERSSGS